MARDELKELEAERRKLAERIGEIEWQRAHDESAQYVGRFFKARNSYSGSRHWWWYFKCTNHDGRYVTGFTFQRDNDGRCTVNDIKHLYFETHGFTEISQSDWSRAWRKFSDALAEDEAKCE